MDLGDLGVYAPLGLPSEFDQGVTPFIAPEQLMPPYHPRPHVGQGPMGALPADGHRLEEDATCST